MTCLVKVRPYSDGYIARAGRGRTAKTASCTMSAEAAARSAAAKFFRLDSCNVQTASDIRLSHPTFSALSGTHQFRAELPERSAA